jgi:hypothetical protein
VVIVIAGTVFTVRVRRPNRVVMTRLTANPNVPTVMMNSWKNPAANQIGDQGDTWCETMHELVGAGRSVL